MIVFSLDNPKQLVNHSTLINFCRLHDWASYHTLKNKKLPFEYKGYYFVKPKKGAVIVRS